MKRANDFFKFIGKLGVHLTSLITCYLLSVLYTGGGLIIVLSVISIFKALPEILRTKMWALLLLASIPLSIVFFIIVEKGLIRRERKTNLDVQELEKALQSIKENQEDE